jgi:DNA-binding PadR family transcriptional regulator
LIAVTDQGRAELTAWSKEWPELASRIQDAVDYRARVRAVFDRLMSQRAAVYN